MQQLRVDTAGLQAMATRWDASAGELNETVAPARLGLSFQASAAAVNAAHADITAFTTALATRVGTHAIRVAQADTTTSLMKRTRPTSWPLRPVR